MWCVIPGCLCACGVSMFQVAVCCLAFPGAPAGCSSCVLLDAANQVLRLLILIKPPLTGLHAPLPLFQREHALHHPSCFVNILPFFLPPPPAPHAQAEIIQDPGSYIESHPYTAQALLDMRQAGKQLLLITNSDWHYTSKMMSYAYDRWLPGQMTWRDLFDMVRRVCVCVCGGGGGGARFLCFLRV